MHTHARVQRVTTSERERRPPARAAPVPAQEILGRPGRPVDPAARSEAEGKLGHDFSHVRVHTDAAAATSAAAIDAVAYTVGRDVVFGSGYYQPGTPACRRLLFHELTHVVQQGGATTGPRPALDDPHGAYEQQAEAVAGGNAPASAISPGTAAGLVQRQHRAPGPVSVRSPVAEEAAAQFSDVAAGLSGRALTSAERAIGAGVFGASIDFARVRLIPTDVLEYRTVGNNIRVPRDFTVADEQMAQTLIHELTHVWQYQHGGTSYISHSLQTQIAGALRGNRNFAYDYALKPGLSFFDFTPEQQGLIVENYFSMKRDQAKIAGSKGSAREYESNHFGAGGFPDQLTAAQRSAEISMEMPAHELVIAQMRTALPAGEAAILLQRAQEVMHVPGPAESRDPARELTPVKPLIELRFLCSVRQ